ncbi:hypothetical protein [Methylobacterium oryzisoli]|uniref:hypothetical protein n=1 Tax=Methylobacterium oryzisoli TaxID=3385502 RepID=UPI0038920923
MPVRVVGMNANARYLSAMVSDPRMLTTAPPRLPEQYERVELLRPERTRQGRSVPAGSRGTVVEILGDHEAFMVEFQQPFAALLTVRPATIRSVSE